jgi:Uma2 family endonuclease
MSVTIAVDAIHLAPGSFVSIPNLSWQDFETILTDLGEHRKTRLTYYKGTLEIMSPLALHERPHRIMADIVKTILDVQGRDWEDFGSTTVKRPNIAGVEPDTCFYIQNASQVRGCTDMNLAVYPPPDLAIESDVTSTTTLDAYEALGIPEVWIYRNSELRIYLLQDGKYVQSETSPTFPDLVIATLIPDLVQQGMSEGTSKMLRSLRRRLLAQM